MIQPLECIGQGPQSQIGINIIDSVILHANVLIENQKEKNNLEDFGIDGNVNRVKVHGLDLCGSE
jgi:hypothetical protein